MGEEMKDEIIDIHNQWSTVDPNTVPGKAITKEVVEAAEAVGYVITPIRSAPSFVVGFFTGLIYALKYGIPPWVEQLQNNMEGRDAEGGSLS